MNECCVCVDVSEQMCSFSSGCINLKLWGIFSKTQWHHMFHLGKILYSLLICVHTSSILAAPHTIFRKKNHFLPHYLYRLSLALGSYVVSQAMAPFLLFFGLIHLNNPDLGNLFYKKHSQITGGCEVQGEWQVLQVRAFLLHHTLWREPQAKKVERASSGCVSLPATALIRAQSHDLIQYQLLCADPSSSQHKKLGP